MKENLLMLALEPQAGQVEELGTVYELFGSVPKAKFNDKNRVNFQFFDPETNKRWLVVLSNGLANAYATGKLTKEMCWNLPVYKVSENQDGEPLTDRNGNVIKHILVMGSPQTDWTDTAKIKKDKVAKHIYTPSGSGAFDNLI